jgi:hypothetical protein
VTGLILLAIFAVPALLFVGGARWTISRMRRLDLAEIREAQTWATHESWMPCPSCGGPMRPNVRICEVCNGA